MTYSAGTFGGRFVSADTPLASCPLNPAESSKSIPAMAKQAGKRLFSCRIPLIIGSPIEARSFWTCTWEGPRTIDSCKTTNPALSRSQITLFGDGALGLAFGDQQCGTQITYGAGRCLLGASHQRMSCPALVWRGLDQRQVMRRTWHRSTARWRREVAGVTALSYISHDLLDVLKLWKQTTQFSARMRIGFSLPRYSQAVCRGPTHGCGVCSRRQHRTWESAS